MDAARDCAEDDQPRRRDQVHAGNLGPTHAVFSTIPRSGSTTIRPNAGSEVPYSVDEIHFGSKSARGTEVAAILYSLVESAKASGIDPIAYLTEVATRAKESPGAVLLPADFSAQLAAA